MAILDQGAVMSYPMPTIVGKGDVLVRVDTAYEDPSTRLESLKRLHTPIDIVQSGVTGGLLTPQTQGDPGDQGHMNSHWFGPQALNWWNVLVETAPGSGTYENTPLTHQQRQQARKSMKLGFKRALARSLGLTESDTPPDDISSLDPDTFRPVKVYWVCGKLDGIEVQVAESNYQIDLFIVTPPLQHAAQLCWEFPQSDVDDLNKETYGMVLVHVPEGQQDPVVTHVHLNDGGIADKPYAMNVCPESEPRVRTEPNIGYGDRVELDDCANAIGGIADRSGGDSPLAQSLRQRLVEQAATGEAPEFAGMDELVIDIQSVSVAQRTLWAGARVRGKHVRVAVGPDEAQPTFLGWQPTGNETVEFDLALRGTYAERTVGTLELLWDKQSVHGQLGVRAIGRPVPRSRAAT